MTSKLAPHQQSVCIKIIQHEPYLYIRPSTIVLVEVGTDWPLLVSTEDVGGRFSVGRDVDEDEGVG